MLEPKKPSLLQTSVMLMTVDKRGLSMQDQLTMATLSHVEFREESKNIRELLALANQEETNALSALKLTCEMLEKCDDEREKKYHHKRKLEILARLEELESQKRRLQDESDKLREYASRKKKAGASLTTPRNGGAPMQQVSISHDETTMNSSISNSGSSEKKKRNCSKAIVDLMDSDEDKTKQSSIPESSPIYKKGFFPTKDKLNDKSKNTMRRYQEKMAANHETNDNSYDYGDY
jgi:hypothetical protein